MTPKTPERKQAELLRLEAQLKQYVSRIAVRRSLVRGSVPTQREVDTIARMKQQISLLKHGDSQDEIGDTDE